MIIFTFRIMKTSNIQFFKEGVSFRIPGKKFLGKWIVSACRGENAKPGSINIIFCSDRYLLKLNSEYLNHHYFTDVITFDHSEGEDTISGDIYISVDRVRSNARRYGCSFRDELHRVIIHGSLHLTGYRDDTQKRKEEMRRREDYWLKCRSKFQ